MYEVRTSNNGSSSRVPEPLFSTTSDGSGDGLPTTLLEKAGELDEGVVKAQTASPTHSASSVSTNEAGGRVLVYIIATK